MKRGTSRGTSSAVKKATNRKLPTRNTRTSRAQNDKKISSSNIKTVSADVPQVDIKDAIEVLKQFDMNMRYGPCVGIKRSQRWNRAKKFNLNPPLEVKSILDDNKFQKAIANIEHDLWYNEFN